MATTPDYAGVEDSIKQGYDAQRQKAAQQEAGNLQGQRDALARRQAQLGGGPGGAFVKAEQQAGNESAIRGQAANASINDAQAAELRGVKETQLGQQFTAGQQQNQFAHEDTSQKTGIAAAQQQQATGIAATAAQNSAQIQAQKDMQAAGISATSSLADKQAAVQQAMQKTGIDAESAMQAAGFTQQDKELSKSQAFQAATLTAQQLFADSQRKQTQSFQADQAKLDRDIKVDEFLQTIGLSREQFAEQTGVDMFNEKIAQQMADKKDMLEKTFDQFGMNKIKDMFQQGGGNGASAADTSGGGGILNAIGSFF